MYLQPGQTLPSILDFGKAEVGGLHKGEEQLETIAQMNSTSVRIALVPARFSRSFYKLGPGLLAFEDTYDDYEIDHNRQRYKNENYVVDIKDNTAIKSESVPHLCHRFLDLWAF